MGARLFACVLACGLAAQAPAWAQPQPGELVERTLALVAGQVITLSDARAAIALGLVDPATADDPVEVGTGLLVDRELMLREVQRYAPPEPADEAIAAGLAEVQRLHAAPGALQRVYDSTGFTDARLRAWVRDDLRVQAYLAQRFAAAGAPTAPEAPARRRELIADWVADLRRRTTVVILAK